MKILKISVMIFLVFSLLIGADNNTSSVKVLTKTTKSWNGKELPRYPWGKPEITILRIEIPAQTELSWHEHPVINAGVVLSGELTVITDKSDTLQLKAGDPIVEVVNRSHYGVNLGEEPVDIIVFYAGVKGKAITLKSN